MGEPKTNKLTKWLIIVIVALLAMIIVAGWLINDKRNNYDQKITEKEVKIKELMKELAHRDSVTAEMIKKQAIDELNWKKQAALRPKLIIKHEKTKDSLRVLPPDEQLLFLSERLAKANREGHW